MNGIYVFHLSYAVRLKQFYEDWLEFGGMDYAYQINPETNQVEGFVFYHVDGIRILLVLFCGKYQALIDDLKINYGIPVAFPSIYKEIGPDEVEEYIDVELNTREGQVSFSI